MFVGTNVNSGQVEGRKEIITDFPITPQPLTDDDSPNRSHRLETVLAVISRLAVLWAFGLALLLILAQRS